MSRQIPVNLPVRHLPTQVVLFKAPRLDFNRRFTDENATCKGVADGIHLMRLVESCFQDATDCRAADALADRIAGVPVLRQRRRGRPTRCAGGGGRARAPHAPGPRLHVRAWLRGSGRPSTGAGPHAPGSCVSARAGRVPKGGVR